MATKAFVLIETGTGKCAQVVTELRRSTVVKSADAVTGPYDIIVIAEKDALSDISELIDDKIHHIEGVTRTVTCVTI